MKKLVLILSLFLSINGFSQFILNSYRFGAAAFSPSDIAGLRLWVQADNLALANNDPVDTWTDLSGNSNDFTSTTTLRPLYITNVQNGKPVVRFDGTDDFMEKASPTGLDGGGAGLTIFIVAKHPITANRTYLAKWDYQTQGSWAFQTNGTNALQGYIATTVTDVGGSHNVTTNAALTNAFYLLELVYDGSQGTNANRVKFYKNTTSTTVATTGTFPTTLVSSTATLKVGKFGGTLPRVFNSDIGEILIYDNTVSDVNRALVQTYLNARWALY